MLIDKIINFFKPKEQEPKIIPQKTIKDLEIFDTVWVYDEELFEGWIMDITRRCIVVCYGPDLRDFRFRMEKPLTNTEIHQNNKILYCNEPK